MGSQKTQLPDTLFPQGIFFLSQSVVNTTDTNIMYPPQIIQVIRRGRLHIHKGFPKMSFCVVTSSRRTFISLTSSQRAFLIRHPKLFVEVVLPTERICGSYHLFHFVDCVQIFVRNNTLWVFIQYGRTRSASQK